MNNNNKLQEKNSGSPLICLAEITSPYGLKGAVKIKTFTEFSSDISHYKLLKDQNGAIFKYRLLSMPSPQSAIISVEGVVTRNDAEKLRGTKLYVSRDDLPQLEDEEEFYHADLIGMTVVDKDGASIGSIYAVHNHGAGDFFDIKVNAGQIFSIPFTKDAIPIVNIKAKSVTIDPAFLLDSKV